MKADSYRFDGSGKCRLDKLATDSKTDGVDKEKILAKTTENLQKMAALQDAFYADGREGLIFVLQAMDAAGKDSTIKHVMSGLNPQGVQVTSFKQPNSEELKHDFLWRVNKALPARGSIAIFNRSYYEDVLVVQLHDLQKGYQMAPRVLEQDKDEFFAQRYAGDALSGHRCERQSQRRRDHHAERAEQQRRCDGGQARGHGHRARNL